MRFASSFATAACDCVEYVCVRVCVGGGGDSGRQAVSGGDRDREGWN